MGLAVAYEKAARAARLGKWTEGSASRFLREVRAVVGGEAAGSAVLETWIQSYLASISVRVKPRTARKYRDTLKAFVAAIGEARTGTLREFTAADAVRWRDGLIASGKSVGTINTDLGIVAAAFAAAPRGMIEHNPFEGLRLAQRKGSAQRRRHFTFEQFSAMIRSASAEWRIFLAVLGYTGARQQEGAQLRWGQVDFDRARIVLVRGKQRDAEHVMPLHPTLAQMLRAARPADAAPTTHVCPGIAAAQVRALSNTFRRRILPAIGIRQEYGERPGVGRQLAAYSLHSLRHSLATWLDAAGATEAERMAILGHDDERVAGRYAHAELERSALALARVPALHL